jgi:negative regulator of sigma E activity
MADTAAAEPKSNSKTALTDAFREHFSGDAPLTEKAKSFAKARPWTSAAFVGIAAMAVLNAVRGVRA